MHSWQSRQFCFEKGELGHQIRASFTPLHHPIISSNLSFSTPIFYFFNHSFFSSIFLHFFFTRLVLSSTSCLLLPLYTHRERRKTYKRKLIITIGTRTRCCRELQATHIHGGGPATSEPNNPNGWNKISKVNFFFSFSSFYILKLCIY